MTDNEFFYDEEELDPIKEPDGNPMKLVPPSEWNEKLIFATEPELAMIAIEAACSRSLWKAARKAARETAMSKADKLIGEDAADPRLRDNAAWDFFNDYIFELLRL